MFNRTTLWILVIALAAGIGLLAGHRWFTPKAPSLPQTQAVRLFPAPRELPAFSLQQSDGTRLVPGELQGHWTIVFLGFTHCPDVCPTTLARLTKLRKQLGKGPDAFSIVLISVDPERDTPADLRDYVTLFDTPVIGLTGTAPQIEQVKKQFGAFSRKVEQPGSGYNVEHTAAVMLMDQNGNFVATLAPEEGDQVALDKLKRITA